MKKPTTSPSPAPHSNPESVGKGSSALLSLKTRSPVHREVPDQQSAELILWAQSLGTAPWAEYTGGKKTHKDTHTHIHTSKAFVHRAKHAWRLRTDM